MTDKRKAFEAEFPIPNSVEWCDGDYKFKQYPTPDNMAELMEFSRIIGAWQGWQARGARQCPKDQSFTAATEYRQMIENDALERAATFFDDMNSREDITPPEVAGQIRAMMKG
jgi:hypothetical protein